MIFTGKMRFFVLILQFLLCSEFCCSGDSDLAPDLRVFSYVRYNRTLFSLVERRPLCQADMALRANSGSAVQLVLRYEDWVRNARKSAGRNGLPTRSSIVHLFWFGHGPAS